MGRLVVLLMLGCGGAHTAPHAAPPPAPAVDAAVADAADADEAPAAAVVEPETPLEDVDTTIEAKDLPDLAGFAKHLTVKRGGEQLLALYVRSELLELAIVENDNGIARRFPLGSTRSKPTNEIDAESFLPRSRVGEYQGPIQFAIRTNTNADDARQFVVFTSGASVAVISRPLAGTTTTWTRVLRLDFANDARFVAIGTTDPH